MKFKIVKLLNSFLYIFFIIHSSISEIRKCGNLECQAIISKGKTTQRYPSQNRNILSCQINELVDVYGKLLGVHKDLWDVKINSRRGLFPSKFIREETVYIGEEKLINVSLGSQMKGDDSKNTDGNNNHVQTEEKVALTGNDVDYKTVVPNTQSWHEPKQESSNNNDIIKENLNSNTFNESPPKNTPNVLAANEKPSDLNMLELSDINIKRQSVNKENEELDSEEVNRTPELNDSLTKEDSNERPDTKVHQADFEAKSQQKKLLDSNHDFLFRKRATDNFLLRKQLPLPQKVDDPSHQYKSSDYSAHPIYTDYSTKRLHNTGQLNLERNSDIAQTEQQKIDHERLANPNQFNEHNNGDTHQQLRRNQYPQQSSDQKPQPPILDHYSTKDLGHQPEQPIADKNTKQNFVEQSRADVNPPQNLVPLSQQPITDGNPQENLVAHPQPKSDGNPPKNLGNPAQPRADVQNLGYQSQQPKTDSNPQENLGLHPQQPIIDSNPQENLSLHSQQPITDSNPHENLGYQSQQIITDQNPGSNSQQNSILRTNHQQHPTIKLNPHKYQTRDTNPEHSNESISLQKKHNEGSNLQHNPDNNFTLNQINSSPYSINRSLDKEGRNVESEDEKMQLVNPTDSEKLVVVEGNWSNFSTPKMHSILEVVPTEMKQDRVVTNLEYKKDEAVLKEVKPVAVGDHSPKVLKDIEVETTKEEHVPGNENLIETIVDKTKLQNLLFSPQNDEISTQLNKDISPKVESFLSAPKQILTMDKIGQGSPEKVSKADFWNLHQTVSKNLPKKPQDKIITKENHGKNPTGHLNLVEGNEASQSSSSSVETVELIADSPTNIEDNIKDQPALYTLTMEYIFSALQPILGEDMSLVLESEIFHSKMSLGSLTLLVIISSTIVIVYLLHLCVTKMSKEAPMLKEMNNIKREMRFAIDENMNLKNTLSNTTEKIQSAAVNSIDSNTHVILESELLRNKEHVSRIIESYEEKIHQVEQELDESTSNGLEMHKMLDELLQSQKESSNFQVSVDILQKKLDTQKENIETMTTDLAIKTHLNDELCIELKSSKDKISKLDCQIEQLSSALQEGKTYKAEASSELKANELQIKKLEEAKSSLMKEVENTKVKIDHLTERGGSLQLTLRDTKSQINMKDAEILVSKECCRKLQKTTNKNLNLSELFDVIELKKNLKVAEKDASTFQKELELRVAENAKVCANLSEVQDQIQQFQHDSEKALLERDDAMSKLSVLTDYFKEKESELNKELESQEHLRIDAEGSFVGIENRIHGYELELASSKSQMDALKVELEDQQQSYKKQLSTEEKKSHDNWIAARASERRFEELRKENSQLRQRLTLMARDDSQTFIKQMSHRLEPANGNVSSPASTDGDLDRTGHSPPLPPGMLPPMFPGGPHLPPPPLSFMGHMPPPPPPFMGHLQSPPLPDRRLPPAGRIASPSFRRQSSPNRYHRRSYSPSSDYSNYSDQCYSPPSGHYSPDRGRMSPNRSRPEHIPNHMTPASRITRKSPSQWCMPPALPNDECFEKKLYPQNYGGNRHHFDKGTKPSPAAQNDR